MKEEETEKYLGDIIGNLVKETDTFDKPIKTAEKMEGWMEGAT